MSDFPTYCQLLDRADAPPGSSWGIFGEEDQRGTLNFIGPDQVRKAASLVKEGKSFNLDHHLAAFNPPLAPHRHAPKHTIYRQSPEHRDDWLDGLFLQATSQVDGLRHFRHPRYGFYNGVDDNLIVSGGPDLGVHLYAEQPIIGRGVLIDLCAHLEADGKALDHAAGEAFSVDALDAALNRQGTKIEPGDIVMIRTGFLDWYFNRIGPEERHAIPDRLRSPGLEQSHRTLQWIWDHRIAVLAADNVAVEALPAVTSSPFSSIAEAGGKRYFNALGGMMHPSMIALLGLCLGELWDLEAFAAACSTDNRFEALVTIKPLNLVGGVGSPANAMAVR